MRCGVARQSVKTQVRRTQVERSGQTRRQLIDAAIALVLERGFANATVLDICRRAEVTTGALQHQFGSKSELMATVVEELFTPFTRGITPLPHPTSVPFEQRVQRLVDRYWRIYHDPRYYAVIDILSATRHDPVLNDIVARFRRDQLAVLEAFMPREFPEVQLSAREMRNIVHLAIDMMRGFTIRALFEQSDALRSEVQAACKRLISERLAAGLPEGQGA